MQSLNEELQATNEELETSKEELQSVNENWPRSNAELQTRVADLSRSNNDMNNLLAATESAPSLWTADAHPALYPGCHKGGQPDSGDVGRPN